MGQFHWDAEGYPALMRREMPGYDELQRRVAEATGTGAADILELGTGTGQTAERLLDRHPGARLTGLDGSADMLAAARARLPAGRVDLREGRLEEPLPPGPYDVVVSALAVHHLGAARKADLFRRAAAVLRPGGRLVLGDVVVPADPADAVTPIDPGLDRPSTVADQLGWLGDAGLAPEVVWERHDLAVLAGTGSSAYGRSRGRPAAIAT